MKKKIKRTLIMSLLLSLMLAPIGNYLVQAQSSNNSFFEIENIEVSKDDNITMKINIDQIDYEEFNFKLESNISLSNIEVNETSSESINNINQNNNDFSFDFSKNDSNINTIILNYSLPNELNVGDTITLKAIITSTNEEDEVLEENYTVTIIEKEEQKEKDQKENETNMEKAEDKKQNDINKDKIEAKNKAEEDKIESKNVEKSTDKNQNSTKTSSSSKKEQVTYNGSDNNYLSSLIVNNYSLNKDFKKESLTYFITLENNVNSLDINVTAEDSNSKIYINGNSNFKTGINKVLISVVAENGNIKNYRIYVKKA